MKELFERVSIRKFTDEPVEDEKIRADPSPCGLRRTEDLAAPNAAKPGQGAII